MRVRTGHVSLQVSDTNEQHTHDIEKIFKRAVERRYAWVTGTEAGPGSGNTSRELIRVSRAKGYRPWVPDLQAEGAAGATDCWLAVREDLIEGDWEPGYLPAIPGSNTLHEEDPELPDKRFGPRGLVNVSFESIPALGKINLGVAHHLTDGRTPDSPWYEWNQKLDRVIVKWMREVGAGPALAFFNLDRNAPDTRNDTERIGDSTTLADELRKWQDTGHGPIDWMSSYNKDGRVSGHNYTVLDDKEFFLHGDHFLLEGVFNIASLKR